MRAGQRGLSTSQPLPGVLEPGRRARYLPFEVRIGARAGPLTHVCELAEAGAQPVHALLGYQYGLLVGFGVVMRLALRVGLARLGGRSRLRTLVLLCPV